MSYHDDHRRGATEVEMRVIKATLDVLLLALRQISTGREPHPEQVARDALDRASVMAQEL
jgi:hypothetical protein